MGQVNEVIGGQTASTSSGETPNPRPPLTIGETSSRAARTVIAGTTVSGESSAPPLFRTPSSSAPPPSQAVDQAKTKTKTPAPAQKAPSSSSSAQDSVKCGVCMDTVSEIKAGGKNMVSTVCGHMFCDTCLKGAMRFQKFCPTCREGLAPKGYHPLFL